jgi:hypothetical protein
MKRSKFGFGLLLALLILGLVSTWAIIRSTAPITETLRRAGERGFLGDWDDAMASMAEAKGCWEKTYPLCASLTDHEPMEDINSLFAQLEVYGESRDTRNFVAVCALLAENLNAIGEAHTLKWWNIL